MKYQNITAKDLLRVVKKLDLEGRSGKRRAKHPVYWYKLDGKRQIRVTLPNVHGGNKTITPGFLKQIRNQLRLKSVELVDLVECPLTKEEYERIVREKLNL